MTMPWGSTEEPTVMETGVDSIPVHVVSTDAKPGKSAAAEFGRWRTFTVANTVGPYSITPGAQRIASRSLRRHRLLLKVNATVGNDGTSLSNSGSVTEPGALATIAKIGPLAAGTYTVSWVVGLAGTLGTDDANNFEIFVTNTNQTVPSLNPEAVGQYSQPSQIITVQAGSFIDVLAVAAATAATIYSAQVTATQLAQSSTDGVIVGNREEICSGSPAIPGQLGGYLQIGDNYRWEVQQELWVCYPSTNSGLPVYVTVCDEVYASAPDAWKDER